MALPAGHALQVPRDHREAVIGRPSGHVRPVDTFPTYLLMSTGVPWSSGHLSSGHLVYLQRAALNMSTGGQIYPGDTSRGCPLDFVPLPRAVHPGRSKPYGCGRQGASCVTTYPISLARWEQGPTAGTCLPIGREPPRSGAAGGDTLTTSQGLTTKLQVRGYESRTCSQRGNTDRPTVRLPSRRIGWRATGYTGLVWIGVAPWPAHPRRLTFPDELPRPLMGTEPRAIPPVPLGALQISTANRP